MLAKVGCLEKIYKVELVFHKGLSRERGIQRFFPLLSVYGEHWQRNG